MCALPAEKQATGCAFLRWTNWWPYAPRTTRSHGQRDFNLERSWRTWCEHIRQDHGRYTVVARVSPQMHVDLPLYLGEHLERTQDHPWAEWSEDRTVATESAETEPDTKGADWMTVILHFDYPGGGPHQAFGAWCGGRGGDACSVAAQPAGLCPTGCQSLLTSLRQHLTGKLGRMFAAANVQLAQ